DPATRYRRTVICVDDQGLKEANQMGLFSLLDADWFSCVDFCRLTLPADVHLELKRMAQQMYAEIATKSIGWGRMALSHLIGISVLLQRYKEVSDGTSISHLTDVCCKY